MLGCQVRLINPNSNNCSKIGKVIEQVDGWWLVRFEGGSQRDFLPEHIQVIQGAADAEVVTASATGPAPMSSGVYGDMGPAAPTIGHSLTLGCQVQAIWPNSRILSKIGELVEKNK